MCYEQFYVDDDGNFDETALKNSSDANDYYQIKDVILPSIQIEMDKYMWLRLILGSMQIF